MKKIKVLIVCGSLNIGGAEKVAQSIALYAPSQEYQFHYLVFHQEEGFYEAPLVEKGCFVHRFAEPSMNYVLFIRNMRQLILTHRFHVVHAHTMFNCGLVMLCARVYDVPVRISHAHSSLDGKRSLVTRLYEHLMRMLILTCSTDLVSCGIQAGNRLYGMSAFRQRGQLVENGIDISKFLYSKEARSRIRTEYNIQSKLVIGHMGRMVPVKNQAFLIDLMPAILKKEPNACLMLAGDGEDRIKHEKRILELGTKDHVILTGNISNTADYLSAMDVFVFPSLYEGMPLTLLEAQANGLPCVVSNTVPTDVFITDLLHSVSLKSKTDEWITPILSLKRTNSIRYNHQLLDSGFSASCSVSKLLNLYKKGSHYD